MANVSNIFAGILGFFIALIIIWATNPIILPIIEMINDIVTRIILTFAWYALIVICGIYLPIHLVTSNDDQTHRVG